MSTKTSIARVIDETHAAGGLDVWVQGEWRDRFPWITQGVTGRGAEEPLDMALFGSAPAGEVADRWERLASETGFDRVVHARQVHGATLLVHRDRGPGLLVAPAADAHVTDVPGVLLTVAAADCVPVFVVADSPRAVALLHAGWRGVAAGVLERGLETLRTTYRVGDGLHVHLGPAICGRCYEVGPEVPRALGVPVADPPRLDLAGALAARAVAAGVPPGHVTRSSACTRCGARRFFSHRAGERERHVAFLGLTPPGLDPRLAPAGVEP